MALHHSSWAGTLQKEKEKKEAQAVGITYRRLELRTKN